MEPNAELSLLMTWVGAHELAVQLELDSHDASVQVAVPSPTILNPASHVNVYDVPLVVLAPPGTVLDTVTLLAQSDEVTVLCEPTMIEYDGQSMIVPVSFSSTVFQPLSQHSMSYVATPCRLVKVFLLCLETIVEPSHNTDQAPIVSTRPTKTVVSVSSEKSYVQHSGIVVSFVFAQLSVRPSSAITKATFGLILFITREKTLASNIFSFVDSILPSLMYLRRLALLSPVETASVFNEALISFAATIIARRLS